MTFISTFTHDEPIDIFLDAAAEMPDVRFYVTGDDKRATPETRARKPDNVVFTGFLSDEDFVALLKGSDAMICLTTYDHTMQRGAYESLYLSRPVIVSNFGVLRDAFPTAAVYVDNSVDSIVQGVRRMQANHDNFEREAVELREFMLERWQRVSGELRSLWATY